MGAQRNRLQPLWDCIQILGYVGLAVAVVIAIPALVVLGLVAAGWVH